VEVRRFQIEKFLDSRASVVQNAEEHVITFSMPSLAINLRQQVPKFLIAQVAQYRANGLLRRDHQNGAAQIGIPNYDW
jgi:hypothetical protein